MCGIFGCIGEFENSGKAAGICLDGLKALEYRGYDSSGVAMINNGNIAITKSPGKIELLKNIVKLDKLSASVCIGHTRWATHGGATAVNAHPHTDSSNSLAIVHNGIIENYIEIKQKLQTDGVNFHSETDSEVIAQLVSFYYKGDVQKALTKALSELKGSFAIALLHKEHPETIFAASKESPLVIGFKEDFSKIFLSSDPNTLRPYDVSVCFLKDCQIAKINKRQVQIFDFDGVKQPLESLKLKDDLSEISKGTFEHYMLKEIFEQPMSIQRAISSFFGQQSEENKLKNFKKLDRVLILGCGTSYHAGLVAKSLFESIAKIPTDVEIASEFRYSDPIISDNTLVIAISQSGETADTLAAVREAKSKKAKILGLCNVDFSTLSREADETLFLNAGPEIGVCSTKAFTSQLSILLLLAFYLAKQNHQSQIAINRIYQQLHSLPNVVEQVLNQAKEIETLAQKYANFEHFFFLGRRYMYPTSLEAALKLKEISYVFASAYPSGEMKHGPIALVDEKLITIVMGGNLQTLDKLSSNIEEIKARKGRVIAFLPESTRGKISNFDDAIFLPELVDELSCIPYSVAGQLFAYYIAKERKTDIDQPRNLAKSVTVE